MSTPEADLEREQAERKERAAHARDQASTKVQRIAATIELPRYSIFMPMDGFEGDLDSSVLYAGESCSLVSDVRPAADIVADADAIRAAAS